MITWLLIGCVVPYLTGCEGMADNTLTGKLWEGSGSSDHCMPAPYPALRIYQTANQKDFLVVYDELHDNDAVIKRRAYLLNQNQKRIEAGHKPRFSGIPSLSQLQIVMIETNGVCATNVTNVLTSLRAVVQPDQRHFILYQNQKEIGLYGLPAYVNAGDRARRIALTPVTVTADVAVCCAVAALVLGLVYLAAKNDSNSN